MKVENGKLQREVGNPAMVALERGEEEAARGQEDRVAAEAEAEAQRQRKRADNQRRFYREEIVRRVKAEKKVRAVEALALDLGRDALLDEAVRIMAERGESVARSSVGRVLDMVRARLYAAVQAEVAPLGEQTVEDYVRATAKALGADPDEVVADWQGRLAAIRDRATPPAVASGEACTECGHIHTPEGCTGEPTPSDVWAGVSPETCDCDEFKE